MSYAALQVYLANSLQDEIFKHIIIVQRFTPEKKSKNKIVIG